MLVGSLAKVQEATVEAKAVVSVNFMIEAPVSLTASMVVTLKAAAGDIVTGATLVINASECAFAKALQSDKDDHPGHTKVIDLPSSTLTKVGAGQMIDKVIIVQFAICASAKTASSLSDTLTINSITQASNTVIAAQSASCATAKAAVTGEVEAANMKPAAKEDAFVSSDASPSGSIKGITANQENSVAGVMIDTVPAKALQSAACAAAGAETVVTVARADTHV